MKITDLVRLKEIIGLLEATSSSKGKIAILCGDHGVGECPGVVEILRLIYDSSVTFGLTSTTASGGSPCGAEYQYPLRALAGRKCTGQKARDLWATYLANLPSGLREIANRVLDKDLGCRTGISIVNKAFKKLKLIPIPEFKVALAERWEGEDIFNPEVVWYASRKMDGVRCLIFYRKGDITFLSREGREFFTLGKLASGLRDSIKSHIAYGTADFVLDGEVGLRTPDGKDNFQGLMSLIRRKNHTIPSPIFHCFDMIWRDDFERGTSTNLLRERWKNYHDIRAHMSEETLQMFPHLKQMQCCSVLHLSQMMDEARREGWEGLILRRNATYQGKRSSDMLKVKDFFDGEYKVEGIKTGTMNVVEDGRERKIETMSAVVINHEGHQVSVGSGWTVEQRKRFFADPRQIIGKTITVQYFEETQNQNGGISLRFPTVKAIHGVKREV